MFLSQGFRVLNSWSRCHASKIWSAKSVVKQADWVLSRIVADQANKHSLFAKSVTSVWHGRQYSSDSKDSDTIRDKERLKLRSDPEIRVWMNQIAQDFETAPFQALVDQQHSYSQHSPPRSSDENVSSVKDASDTASDIEVEEFGYMEDDEDDLVDPVPQERYVPISLERGQRGVFDVEEIVTVLEHENGDDVKVIDIPPEARFVEHMVVVSGKSLRHMKAMAAAVEWLYKRKKKKSDQHFRFEGRECRDWFALDLGNIAVHIFTPEAREHYDLETLWTLGPEHDDQRHYIQDPTLNLSAADLFWLESGSKEQPSSPQTTEGTKTSKTGGGHCEGDDSLSSDSSSESDSDPKDKES